MRSSVVLILSKQKSFKIAFENINFILNGTSLHQYAGEDVQCHKSFTK